MAGQLDGYIRSLEHLKKYGCMPRPPSTTRDGQSIVDAFPQGFKESKLSLLGLGGATVKLYLQPGKPETQVGCLLLGGHGIFGLGSRWILLLCCWHLLMSSVHMCACVQGHFYREPHSGKLAVVLGAGAAVRSAVACISSRGAYPALRMGAPDQVT